jgi:CBS domain-containing protein
MPIIREVAVKVNEIMRPVVDYISATDSIQEAARRMTRQKVGCLTVISGSEAVGVLTVRDIVGRVVARGVVPSDMRVAAAMTRGVVVCKEEDDLEVAARMMGQRGLQQLVVISRHGQLSGTVSICHLIQRIKPAKLVAILEGRPVHRLAGGR